MNKEKILKTALDRLNEQTGIKAGWSPHDGTDGLISFHFHRKKPAFVEIKQEFGLHHLENIATKARKFHPLIVVADTIFPRLKEMLREKKIGYLDTAGNFYLNADNSLVWIDGMKPTQKKKPVTNRAFTKTGLKVVFYLLVKEDAVNLPYRKLANATGIALGNIKSIMDGLKETGYILAIDKNTIKLKNKKALLERWLTGYRETLKPHLELGTYRFIDKNRLDDWKKFKLDNNESKWSGEPAGELMTNRLLPAELTVFTNQKNTILKEWKLIPDENGNIRLYQKFWNDEFLDKSEHVPPLLVYADLMMSDDPRCQETALMVYQKYLKNEFEQSES